MCGIIGSVGQAVDNKKSFIFLTHLLRETQRRGPHSTGHFVVDGITNEVFHFKSPLPAKVYSGLMEWKCISKLNQKALIGHARFKTKGGEYNNSNNHPHISNAGNLALVHNGTIYKFDKHKKDYTLDGESDSEMLLKIIVEKRNIIEGIKEIYNLFGDSGDFACEVVYRNPDNGHTRFFFFRDPGRPGRFVDARKKLGQYFFFSENSIWKDAIKRAIEEDPEIKDLNLDDLPVDIIPSFEIWEVDAQTMEIIKHKIDSPVRREVKPKKENQKTTKVTTTTSSWVKEKKGNGVTIHVPKYKTTYVAPTKTGNRTPLTDSKFYDRRSGRGNGDPYSGRQSWDGNNYSNSKQQGRFFHNEDDRDPQKTHKNVFFD